MRIEQLCIRLEPAQHQTARVLLDVDATVQIAHDGTGLRQAGHRLCDDIHVLDRLERRRDTGLRRQRARPGARAIDDVSAGDARAIGKFDGPDPTVGRIDARDGSIFEDPHPACSGRCAIGHADAHRVGLPILVDPERAFQALPVQHGHHGNCVFRRYHPRAQPGQQPDIRDAPQLLHPLWRLCEPQPSCPAIAGGHAGLGFQPCE